MKNYASEFILFFLFLFCCLTRTYSQVKINSCGLNLVIPSFKEDSVFSEETQTLLKKKVVLPIHQSKANIEIRLYSTQYGEPGPTIIIKCGNSSINIDKFQFYFDSHSNPFKTPNYKNVGPLPEAPNYDLFLYRDSSLKLNGSTWNKFFKDLIDNHFFNIIREDELKAIILKKHPNIEISGEAHIYIQLKVGDYYRNMRYSLSYNEKINDVKEYQDLMNIYTTLNQIK